MSVLDALLPLLQASEGFSDKAYPDPAAIDGEPITIGYGTTKINGERVQLGMTCTKEQAAQWVLDELNKSIIPTVSRLVKVNLNDNQLAAIYDFCYNLGTGNFASSTLLKKINNGDFEGAANEFKRWNKAAGKVMPGLTKRREAERVLFLKPV